MLYYRKKKILFLFFIIIIAFFFSTFEFYHTDKVLQVEDKCPIGIFEKNSVFFIDYAFFVIFIFLFLLLYSVELKYLIPSLQYVIHKNHKRAPPFWVF